MAEVVQNDKGFKVIRMTPRESSFIGFGIEPGKCLCMHCNNFIDKDIYYIAVLNDTMCKECYEEWYKTATNYDEDKRIEFRYFSYYAQLLNI